MAQKICENYDLLSPHEKSIFIGELVHAVQSSDTLFNMAKGIIDKAMTLNLFDGVTFLPEQINEQ